MDRHVRVIVGHRLPNAEELEAGCGDWLECCQAYTHADDCSVSFRAWRVVEQIFDHLCATCVTSRCALCEPQQKAHALIVATLNCSPASAAPVVDKDLSPPKNAAFEVWWKGQIARDFVHAALTELEKVSGPKLVAGQGSFAGEATAISAARRSLDSALSTLDDAKSMVVTASQSRPLQCVKCKHYAETDPRGRCISVYYDAGGSLIYCGCECEFTAAATAAPVEQSRAKWDQSGLKEACQRALKLGRTHQEVDIQLFLDMLLEIERLEAIGSNK